MYGLTNPTFPGYQCHETRHGVLCHVAPDLVIGASLRIYGEWAEEELWLLSHVIRPGDTVLDLGANIGTHSLAFSRFTGPTGRVIAIDAQARAFRLLCLNMALNRADWVVPINAMVGGTLSLRMLPEVVQNEENWGAVSYAQMDEQSVDGNGPLLPLPVVSIDSLRLSNCALIKLDIEGMELDALQGSTETLARCRPAVYFEQTSERNFGSICALLDSLAYDLFWHVARPFNAANFRRNHRNAFGETREVNVLAIPRQATLREALTPHLRYHVSNHTYAPPLAEVDPHTWVLPADAYANLPPPRTRDSWQSLFKPAASDYR